MDSVGADSPPYPPLPVRSVGFLVVVWHKNSCHHWITQYIKIWSIQYQLNPQYFSTYLVCSLEKAFFFSFFFSVELGLHLPIINSRIPPKAYGELKPFLSSFKILSMVLKKVCLKIKVVCKKFFHELTTITSIYFKLTCGPRFFQGSPI